ncbi:MAG: thioredoxin reductase, partial [Chlamydiales bacterium]
MSSYPLVVIGGGPCGMSAAIAAAESGLSVLL